MQDKPIRVLVADDHAIVREGVRGVLASHPRIEVVGEASHGQEAVRLTDELKPDVVVMDIAMPGLDGIQAATRIKREHPAIQVVILTVHDDDEYLLQALKAHAAGYVPKRAAGVDLVAAVLAVYAGGAYVHPSMTRVLLGDYLRRVERAPEDMDDLTRREVEVLTLVAEGLTNQRIAEQLFISRKTVEAHRASIMSKLGCHDRTALVRYAVRKGLIQT